MKNEQNTSMLGPEVIQGHIIATNAQTLYNKIVEHLFKHQSARLWYLKN